MTDATAPTLWREILDADLPSHGYTAEREDWPGAAVFTSPLDDGFNVAVLSESRPQDADALLARLIARFREVGATPRVRVTPLSQPDDWPARLRARGFVQTGDSEVFMRLVDGLRRPANPGVDVRLAPQEADVADFVTTQMAGFGSGSSADFWVAQALRNHERGDYLFFVAYLGDEAVGAASLRLDGDRAGIYGVATAPPYRGRGVGVTLLHAAVGEAHRHGASVVFLSALPDSYASRLYESLGFEPLFTVDTYELPGDDHQPPRELRVTG